MAHHKLTGGNITEAGRLQIPLTSFYIGIEPSVIRLLDRTTRFFIKVKGKPVLAIMSRLLGRLLPTGEVITYQQAADFIDAISVLENTEITVGPCSTIYTKRDWCHPFLPVCTQRDGHMFYATVIRRYAFQ